MTALRAKYSENPVVWSDLETIIQGFRPWNFYNSQTILITGGSGLLASYLVRVFLLANDIYALNLKVTCLVRSRRSSLIRLDPWLESSNLQIVYGDAESYPYDQLERQTIVVHAASGATPRVYKSNPVGIILPNSVGTARLCWQACKWQSKRFLFFSTGEVYGLNSSPGFTERDFGYLDPTQLRSCYAESKRCGETTCVAYSHQYGLHALSARIFHTYGPQMNLDDGRVFADFIRDALDGREIRLASSGDALRCFCYLSDATSAFLHLIALGSAGEVYNMANPSAEISILGLAHLVANLIEPPLSVGLVDTQLAKPDYMHSQVLRSLPSTSKLEGLGWQPLVGLEEGFSRTLLSYSK